MESIKSSKLLTLFATLFVASGLVIGCGGGGYDPMRPTATQSGPGSGGSSTQTLATLSITEGPTIYMGSVGLGSTVTTTYHLANAGQTAATAIAGQFHIAEFYFAGGSYPGTGGSCGSSLDGGHFCTIAISFTPAAIPLVSSPLDLAYNNGSGSVSVTGPTFSGQSFAH